MIISGLKFTVFNTNIEERRKLGRDKGVYVILIKTKRRKRIFYIGRTGQLKFRMSGHLKLFNILKSKLLISEELKIAFLKEPDWYRRKYIETILIAKFRPEYNKHIATKSTISRISKII